MQTSINRNERVAPYIHRVHVIKRCTLMPRLSSYKGLPTKVAQSTPPSLVSWLNSLAASTV